MAVDLTANLMKQVDRARTPKAWLTPLEQLPASFFSSSVPIWEDGVSKRILIRDTTTAGALQQTVRRDCVYMLKPLPSLEDVFVNFTGLTCTESSAWTSTFGHLDVAKKRGAAVQVCLPRPDL
ncbi:MAG: hypothetical protein R3B54_00200 [Bdellovibrionota bacterium]